MASSGSLRDFDGLITRLIASASLNVRSRRDRSYGAAMRGAGSDAFRCAQRYQLHSDSERTKKIQHLSLEGMRTASSHLNIMQTAAPDPLIQKKEHDEASDDDVRTADKPSFAFARLSREIEEIRYLLGRKEELVQDLQKSVTPKKIEEKGIEEKKMHACKIPLSSTETLTNASSYIYSDTKGILALTYSFTN